MSELLTYAEAADRLRVSKATVQRLVKAGELETVLISKVARRVLAESLAAYLARQRNRKVA